MKEEQIGSGYHVLAKPAGPLCNLNCTYCFYTEKQSLFNAPREICMSEDVLERFIKNYIQSQSTPEIQFVWQGGEPTILDVSYYEKVLRYQKKYGGTKNIINILQTNGTLLDERWLSFLKKNDFLVGLSLDGPEHIHDKYRLDKKAQPTYKKVIQAMNGLKRFGVPFNVLVCVSNESVVYATEIYQTLKELDVKHIQFTPIVERFPDSSAMAIGLRHATPGSTHRTGQCDRVTPFSVKQGDYGEFLIEIFDMWVRSDVGNIYVSNFEWALQSWLGLPSTVCIFSETCGKALAIEHNGDIYACDHFVYPEYYQGNIAEVGLETIASSERMRTFGASKRESLPAQCLACDVYFACRGECPRHRFDRTKSGEAGLSYLCKDYNDFFRHVHPYMKVFVKLIQNGFPASDIMKIIKGPQAYVID